MTVPAIPAVTPNLPSLPTLTAPAGAGAGAEAAGGSNRFVDALEELQASHAAADSLATQAATGDLSDVHDYMIAATEASLATEMTVAVRNRAVEAFTSIMQMQV